MKQKQSKHISTSIWHKCKKGVRAGNSPTWKGEAIEEITDRDIKEYGTDPMERLKDYPKSGKLKRVKGGWEIHHNWE